MLRTDLGTENSNISFLQPLLRTQKIDYTLGGSMGSSHIYINQDQTRLIKFVNV